MKYSFRDAAIKILERFSEPKTAKEITDTAIEEGLIETAVKHRKLQWPLKFI
jgi:hypothetical protein